MLIDGYYSQLNLIDTSKWTKSHYKGGMGEYERLKKALAIHEKAAARSAVAVKTLPKGALVEIEVVAEVACCACD